MPVSNKLLETNFTPTIVAIGLALAITSAMILYHQRSNNSIQGYKGLKSIPVPKGNLPIFGHLLSIDKLMSYKLKEWHDELGPVIQIQMGAQPWISISDPLILHYLFVTNGAIGSKRPTQLFTEVEYAHGQRGIAFANPDRKWKVLRTASLNMCLAPKVILQNNDGIQRDVEDLVTLLMSDCESRYSIDPTYTIRCFVLKYVFRSCYGVDTSDEAFVISSLNFATEVLKNTGAHMDIGGFLPMITFVKKLFGYHTSGDTFFHQGEPLLRRLLSCAIDSDRDCMFKKLYEQQHELGLDEMDLLNCAADMLVGATDNIAITSITVLAVLLHYPEVHMKLRNEVDTFIRAHGRLPVFSERSNFPYLNATMKEVMRYRGSNYITIPHALDEDVLFKDYLFPKNTMIIPLAYAIHKDPVRYPEPDKFKPERFIDDLKSMTASTVGDIAERDHFIFGWGRRICPGAHLGEVQLFYIVTSIIARCNLELPKDGTMPDLVNVIDKGIVVIPPPFEIRFSHREDSLLS